MTLSSSNHHIESMVFQNKKVSIAEGCLYAVMVAFGESLIIPYALSMGMRPSWIGILATLPVALGGISQFLSPQLAHYFKSFKNLIFIFMCLQITGLIILWQSHIASFHNLLIGASLYWFGGAAVQTLWAGWMIPTECSEKLTLYHARRNALIALITFFSFIIAGYLLWRINNPSMFRYLFFVGATARIFGLVLIIFHRENRVTIRKGSTYKNPLSSEKIKYFPFIWYLIGVLVFFRVSAGFLAPHFSQYMLVNRQMSYFTYSFLIGCAFLGRTLFLERWLISSHRFGYKNTILTSCVVLSIVPMLWIFSSNMVSFILLELIAGGGWGGFELISLILIANLGLPGWNRYFGLLNGLITFGCLGSGWLGGKFLEWGYPMEFLFAHSCFFRGVGALLVGLLFYQFTRQELEPKKFLPIFFSTLSLRPSFGNIQGLFWRRKSSP